MGKKLRAAALAAMMGLAALMGSAAACEPGVDDLPEMPGASDLAGALTRAHEENPVRFRRVHMGETVQATGRIHRIHGDGTVELMNGRAHYGADRILCKFDDLDLVAQFNKDEDLTFTGTVESADRGMGTRRKGPPERVQGRRQGAEMTRDKGRPRNGII